MADDLREKIAGVLAEHRDGWRRKLHLTAACSCGWSEETTGDPEDASTSEAHQRHVAEAILAAIGEVRDEWRVVGTPVRNVARPEFEQEFDTEREARALISDAQEIPSWVWPWAEGPFVQTRTLYAGPWLPVDTEVLTQPSTEESRNGR